MKKYFMSIVALFAVTFTVMTFSSCSKDDEKEVKESVSYTYEAAISDDLLKLYDVEVVAKYSNEKGNDLSENYAFTDSMTFAAMSLQSYVPGMKISKKSFVGYKDSGAVTCTVKLKSNWKDIVASMYKIYVCYSLDAYIGADQYTAMQQGTINQDDATQTKLEDEAKVIANALSVK